MKRTGYFGAYSVLARAADWSRQPAGPSEACCAATKD
jgi:hypothetical protein